MDVKKYFDRIGLAMPETVVPDSALLKQLHLAHAGLLGRWRRLYVLCRDFSRSSPKLPRDLRSRLLALPVRLRLTPAIDLLGKKLSK